MIHDTVSLTAAFLIGLFSTVHCIGMCGSIMGALSLSLPVSIQNHRFKRLGFVSSYNLGRIVSYSIAGLIAGGVGFSLLEISNISSSRFIAQIFTVAMMIIIGLYLAGWLPQMIYLERIGAPVWRKLEPVGRKLLPVDTVFKAFIYGMIWGWLPCGLVYSVLIWTLSSGSAINGALTMLAFGIGTMPTLISAGVMTSWITSFSRSKNARRIVGLIIIMMAIGSLFIPMDGGHHH